MADEVVPFKRPDKTPAAREVHSATQRAAAARELAAVQNAAARQGYDDAARRQSEERLLRDGVPVPARMTIALGDLGGPDVDIRAGTFEGNPAGDVDAWEDPDDPRLPTAGQVRLLAQLTGFPIGWFYEPYTPRLVRGMICWRDRRGCEEVTGDGVPVPPGREPGQHVLPGMPAAEPSDHAATPVAASTARSNTSARSVAPASPARNVQLELPAGRLADAERARLMERLATARTKRH